MGQKSTGIQGQGDAWHVDKRWRGTRIFQRGFTSFAEAEGWLIKQLAALRATKLHGERRARTFDDAAAHYVQTHEEKVSLDTEITLLQGPKKKPELGVMHHIAALELHQVHDGTLAPYVAARLAAGHAHKTVNLALAVVRRILNLAASTWRDEEGRTWLEQAPAITMLALVGHQREPRPITWGEQRQLLPRLPDHLGRMALFVLNTGVRDDVVCSLRWEWEIPVPELGVSVFEVPRRHVKGRKRTRLVVCNSVAQSVVEACRGRHPEFVFVYRRERVKNVSQAPAMPYRPIATMNNTGWQNARSAAELGDLHVHDLRHTVGMRLREAGVAESTTGDILWHARQSMTHHYTMAQIVELHGALEKIKADSGAWNKSLTTLRLEHQASRVATSHANLTQRKTA